MKIKDISFENYMIFNKLDLKLSADINIISGGKQYRENDSVEDVVCGM